MLEPLSSILYSVKIYKLFEFNKGCGPYGEYVRVALFVVEP